MGSSTAELGRALDAATPTFDLERIVDALKATERSAPDAIGGAGERSSYQIMQPTFHGIRRLRPDLPEIQFSDLSKPENEETARQYAKAIVEDIASRSPDPKDIAAGYNSGKTARNAPHVTKTDYVPRFLRALGSVLSPGEAQAAEPGSDEARLGAALDAAKVEPEDEARLGAALDVGGEAPIPAQAVVDYYAGPDASFGMGALGTIADSPLGVAEQFLFKHAEIPLLETLAGKDSPAAENARKRFAEQQALIGEGQQAAGIIRERGGAQSLGLRALGVGATIAPAMLAPQTLLSVPGFAATGAVTGAMRPFTGPEDGTAMDALKGAATEGGMNAVTALLFGGAGRLGAAAFPGSRTAQIGSQALVGGIQGGVMEGPQGAFENALLGVPFGMVSNTRPGLKGAPLKERLAEVVNPLSDLLPFSTGLQRRQLGVSQNLQFADTTLPGSLGHERTPTVGDLKAAGKTNTEILAAIGVQNQARSAGAPAEAARGIDTFLEQFGRPLTTEQFKTQAVFNPDWKAFDVPFGEHPVERQGGQTGTYYQSSQVRGLIERATKVTQAVDPALVEIAGANHQTLEAALTRLAAEKQAAGPRSTTEQILDNVVIRRKKPLQQEEQAAVDDGIKVAEETGAAPEGYGKLVEGVSDAEQLVAEAVAARGGTMITSESVPNAMLPPAGMLNVDLNSLSKADLLIALDQFPALARLRNPAVMMNSNPLTGKAYEELQISDHQKRILLHGGETGEGWVQAFQRALTTPRKFIPKLLPVEDLIAIGKALDGREDGKALVASRPDLIPRVEALQGLLREIADTAGLPPGMRISEYFPHMLRLLTERHVDLPPEIAERLGPGAAGINERLRSVFDRRTAPEVKRIREAILGKKPVEEALAKTPNLIEVARETQGIMRDVLDGANIHGPEGAAFIKQYMNSLLRGDAKGRRLINQPVDIIMQLPVKKIFFGSLDKERVDLNPEYLDYNAYNVLRLYIYAAARKIAFDAHAPKINALMDEVKATATEGARNEAYRYGLELIDNYVGRNKEAQNRWLTKRLENSKILTRLSESDHKTLQMLASAIRTPQPATRLSNFIRTVEFSSKIGLNAISPIVNSFQPLVNVAPILSTNKNGTHVPGLGELWLARSFLHWTNSGGFRQIREFAARDGMTDFVGKFDFDPEVMGRYSRNVVQALTWAFRFSEKNNRSWTYTAGYMKRYADLAGDVANGKMPALEAQNASRLYAKALVERTQFSGGKLGTPLMAQGPLGSVVLQFKTFGIKEADLFKSMTNKEKLHFVTLLVTLGGIGAIPILNVFDPQDEYWPGLLRTAGIDLSDQFDLMSIVGLPRNSQELGGLAGPFFNDLYRMGEKPSLENALRFAPGGVQMRRVEKGNTLAQQLFGQKAAGGGGGL